MYGWNNIVIGYYIYVILVFVLINFFLSLKFDFEFGLKIYLLKL